MTIPGSERQLSSSKTTERGVEVELEARSDERGDDDDDTDEGGGGEDAIAKKRSGQGLGNARGSHQR